MEVLGLATDGLSFEESFARLEETVKVLESGELSLAEMVSVYEQGIALSEHCARLLDAAELRVSQLAQSRDGELQRMPLELGNSFSFSGES